jgi:hypothetical protein
MHQHNSRNPWVDHQWQVKDPLRPSHLCRIPRRRPNLIVLPSPGKGKVSWTAATLRRPIQGDPRINYAFYRIHHYPSGNTMVVHLYRLEPYLHTTRDKQPWRGGSVTWTVSRRDQHSLASTNLSFKKQNPPPLLLSSLRTVFAHRGTGPL